MTITYIQSHRLYLSVYYSIRFTTLLTDDAMFVCLPDDVTKGFLLKQFDTGNRWVWTHIDYRPYITSEATYQVY